MRESAVEKKVILDGESEKLTELGGFLPASTSLKKRPEPAFAGKWKERAQRLHKEAHVFYFVLKHPRTRWYARVIAGCTAAYLLSPVQLIPNFIPIIGFLDDFLVVLLGAKILQRITPVEVFIECRQLADAAEISRKEEIRSVAATAGYVAIVTLWMLAAVGASAIIASYFRH